MILLIGLGPHHQIIVRSLIRISAPKQKDLEIITLENLPNRPYSEVIHKSMEHFSRMRWTTKPAPSVSYSVHEGIFFISAMNVLFLKLIYYVAGMVVHLHA